MEIHPSTVGGSVQQLVVYFDRFLICVPVLQKKLKQNLTWNTSPSFNQIISHIWSKILISIYTALSPIGKAFHRHLTNKHPYITYQQKVIPGLQ